MEQELLKKITDKTATIGIIGLGYVGLPLVIEFCKAGFKTIGFDVDAKKIDALKNNQSYIQHIDSKYIESIQPLFTPTANFEQLSSVDSIIVCVPTPLNKNREPDLSYITTTTNTIAKYLKKGQLVVLESTTFPGTTDQDMKSLLEVSGLQVGKDFFLAYSPEREDPNNGDFSTSTVPKVVGGFTNHCLECAAALYTQIIEKVVPVSSTRVAEATKLLENIYRSVNIALVNELKVLFDRMDIDVWEVIEAAKTKPFGFHAFYPGPGIGGHCIPVDPFYLTWKAREYDYNTRFIELAGEINSNMPYYVMQKTMEGLNEAGKSLRGAKTLLLGVAYKKDVDDMRESPSLKLLELLFEKGATVDYHDPAIHEISNLRNYQFELKSVPFTPEQVRQYDVVIIATDHTAYQTDWLYPEAKLIIDTRNIMNVSLNDEKVIKA